MRARSGKLPRRAIQALCEGYDPGDLTKIEDPSALEADEGGDNQVGRSKDNCAPTLLQHWRNGQSEILRLCLFWSDILHFQRHALST